MKTIKLLPPEKNRSEGFYFLVTKASQTFSCVKDVFIIPDDTFKKLQKTKIKFEVIRWKTKIKK